MSDAKKDFFVFCHYCTLVRGLDRCEGHDPIPDDLEFVRASGDTVCEDCNRPYHKHRPAYEYVGAGGLPFLRVLCNEILVKL